ncbi:MAG: hypothetical protein SPL15_00405 [Lachnospiraceae bacterium]|nr:hypothetical protein [Lachnospiraceae bacterium]MDY5741450.1 hypothetical protein [Lachnospiraceae bacterium]
MRIYKIKRRIIITKVIIAVISATAVGLVLSFLFEDQPWIAAVGSPVILGLMLWLNVIEALVTVTLEGERLTVISRRGESSFDYPRCFINSRRRVRWDCLLDIFDEQDRRHLFDCSLIGRKDFEELIAVIGTKKQKRVQP